MAKAICGEHASAAQYEQALTIAECEILILNLRAARVAAVLASEQSPTLSVASVDVAARRTSEDQQSLRTGKDVDAFRRALPELDKMDRYERRAMSRRKRAIRMFEAISTFAPSLARNAKRR